MTDIQQPEALPVLIERMRSLHTDHEPGGWPAVRTREITALIDRIAELEAQLEAIGAGGVSGPLMTPTPTSGAADLRTALVEACRAIISMKVEAETAAQGDEQMILEACETISNEGLQADMAIRASHGQAPAQPQHIEAMERAWLWMENQADGQSKGGHATFDLMMLREERDALRTAIDTAPSPQAAQQAPLKDHQIAALVNELRDIAVKYHGTQQLRERIAQVVVPAVRAAQQAPAGATADAIDAMAIARYKVVPSDASMFHRFAVVAGDGKQQLYLGREVECENMARKFAGAFLDGAFYQSNITPPTQAADSVLYDPKAVLETFNSARAGSDKPVGYLRGILAVIAHWESRPEPHRWMVPAKEADSVLEDAARYRWLRDESWAGYNSGNGTPKVYTIDGAGNRKMQLAEDAMDSAVDAARAAQKEGS